MMNFMIGKSKASFTNMILLYFMVRAYKPTLNTEM